MELKKSLLLVLIPSFSFLISAQSTQLEQMITDHREVGYQGGQEIDTLLEFFLLNRYAKHRGATPYFEKPAELDLQCIYHLVTGEHQLYGHDRQDSLAYESFLEAYHIAQELNSDVLQCESLRRVISYCQFTQSNLSEVGYFIKEHQKIAYDPIERLTNDLLSAKDRFEAIYRDSTADQSLLAGELPDILDKASQESFYHIAAESALVLAIAQALNGEILSSALTSSAAMEHGKNYSRLYDLNVSFTATANIGWAFYSAQQFAEAIPYLRKALDLMPPSQIMKQSSKLYDWMSTCYEGIDQRDSAILFLRHYNESLKNELESKNLRQVAEIQAKYEDEVKSRQLAESLVQKRNYALIAAITFGLLTISLVNYRRLEVKRKLLREELNSAEQKTQLVAVNARLDGRESERKQIAEKLHDSIVGYMVATKVQLKSLLPLIGSDKLKKVSNVLDLSIEQARNLSHELYPPLLASLGLGPALADLVEKYSTDEFRCSITGDWNEVRWKGQDSAKVYYAVQELLTNSVKHSGGSSCTVKFELCDEGLEVSVSDDGRGIMDGKALSGLGMSTVKSRIESIGSRIIFVESDSGCSFRFIIPSLLVSGKTMATT